MYVQMPPGRALLVCRLVRICAACLEHQPHGAARSSTRRSKQPRCLRTFSVGQNHWNDNEEANSDSSPLGPGTTTRLERLPSRRRQSLSPLERVSRLLPQGSLSPEVTQLREQTQQEPEHDVDVQKGDAAVDSSAAPRHSHLSGHPDSFDTAAQTNGLESHGNGTPPHPEERAPATLPGSTLLKFGELLVAEYRKKRQVEFRKMFQLQEGARLHSNWGTVLHNDVAGQPSGRFLKTTLGMPILMRRASLEDYVLYMKRGPAIAYPKDVSAMLMMMDVTEGDCVLESGSGSGAMSLFLSRAVGSKGRVLSVEIREDHHIRAVQNYNRWRASWGIRREEEWPNNVQFHKADLSKASSLLSGWGFHSVALDILNPHLVLPTVIPHLHPGAVCAVYLANITQTIDLMEGLRCSNLPLLCERIIEVPVRDWLVVSALQKDGQYCARKRPITDEEKEEENEESDKDEEEELHPKKQPPFGSVPYIARPHPEQMSHTAFLMRLRKCAW